MTPEEIIEIHALRRWDEDRERGEVDLTPTQAIRHIRQLLWEARR